MALEFGSGTQADPYLLVNLADVTEWLTNRQKQGYWFSLVADLDVSYADISASPDVWIWNIEGRGHQLSIKYSDKVNNCLILKLGLCVLNNISLTLKGTFDTFSKNTPTGTFVLNDSIINVPHAAGGSQYTTVSGRRGLIIDGGRHLLAASSSVDLYRSGWFSDSYTKKIDSFADKNPFNRVNYPSFSEEKWIFDGISLPRPRPQATADLTNRYGVKGQTKVGGSNRQRNLAVFTENGLRYKVQDTKADGSFFLNLNDVSTPVIVMAYDDIGAKAAINTAYSLNQIIHPAIPNGFRYRCTLAGNSGATIPSEPWPTSAVLTIGAAKFTPEPVYEPKAHGPLLPVLFNVVTEQPA